MLHAEALGLLVGAVVLGAIHGIEPGHGWPVAATYALDRTNPWLSGFAASLILGIGHLVSSIAMVLVFFYAKRSLELTQINKPIHLAGDISLGGPVSLVAGLLLVGLGIREYRHGHTHGGSGDAPDHSHSEPTGDDHDHHHDRGGGSDRPGGLLSRLGRVLPVVGNRSRADERYDDAADRGLLGIASFAFLLGFAHEEEFEIIALCAGSVFCLELMLAYATAVIVGIVGLTMLLIAGYEHFEERVERYTPHLPAFSAAVLVLIGVGFITGLF